MGGLGDAIAGMAPNEGMRSIGGVDGGGDITRLWEVRVREEGEAKVCDNDSRGGLWDGIGPVTTGNATPFPWVATWTCAFGFGVSARRKSKLSPEPLRLDAECIDDDTDDGRAASFG